MRAWLYQGRKHSFGCDGPTANKPATDGKPAVIVCPPGCRKHLDIPELEEADGTHLPRLRMLSRLEAMVNVGCRFSPNDLAIDVWRDLILLAQERQWIDEVVREKGEAVAKEQAQRDKDAAAAKQKAGIPESKFGKPR